MTLLRLHGERIDLQLKTRASMLAAIEAMEPSDRAQVSPVWLERLQSATEDNHWLTGFRIILRQDGADVGLCAFKGPPDTDGAVEIAYGIDEPHRCQGFATEAAALLRDFALTQSDVQIVRAHTLPEPNASTRVLTRCGFRNMGDVIDPEDGRVWRWEYRRDAATRPAAL